MGKGVTFTLPIEMCIRDRLKGSEVTLARYIYDDSVDTSDKSIVIDWYYRKYSNGKRILHYCKYVGNTVIYATENDTEKPVVGINPDGSPVYGQSREERGWYDPVSYTPLDVYKRQNFYALLK